jgi:EAL domain-containing protein (putative c-di-GMP-specific phosphodiesterase class I)
VDLGTGQTTALEALIRWRHPEEGLLLPGEFISLAERSALIERVDDRALREALRQIRGWRERGMPAGRLPAHVNLSAHQLDAARARSLVDAVRRSGVEPGAIVFEVTEGVLLERTAAREALAVLHDAGHRVALDDFGVRYAVLAELTDLPFDLVKLDRSFLVGAADPRRARLVSGVVGILRDLGVTVIAEGVETEAERRFLIEAGSVLGQGYLFSRPVSAATLERMHDAGLARPELRPAARAIPA